MMVPKPSFEARLQQRALTPLWGVKGALGAYHLAAAVLGTFDPATLKPVHLNSDEPEQDRREGRPPMELLADCEPATDSRWSLRKAVRQAALHTLIQTHGVDRALAANSDREHTPAQFLFERYLRGDEPREWDTRSLDECRALLAVDDWLRGMPEFEGRLPTVAGVADRIARHQLLQPFRELVGTGFAGRTMELNSLADYVGVQEAHSISESLARVIEVFSLKDRPPLLISGPGGCGKSTLLARFILDHAEGGEGARIPFAYLDFDRPGLVAEEPATLLMEILRQLSIQFPTTETRRKDIVERWERQTADRVEKSPEESSHRLRFGIEERADFMNTFADFVRDLKTEEQQPLLLVLDTFEEVQFRSAAFADGVLAFLDALQARLPRLRTVLSGRDDIRSKDYHVRQLRIGNFDSEAAVAFLTARGVEKKTAGTIFEQVGGSPLVLRLAADLAAIENLGEAGIDGLPSRWLSLFRSSSIEVVLYKRILAHVRDERVRTLAYPGLVLRTITPEIVERVLAPACNVAIGSPSDAKNIVETLSSQLSTILVPAGGDRSTLTHRADMRPILLDDLKERSQKEAGVGNQLTNIHHRAVSYYSPREGTASRAEEIYHRLALGVDRSILERRWIDGLSPYLGSSIRELPEASQIYLAVKLGLELPDETWKKADDEDWIGYALRAASQKMEVDRPHDALLLLAERKKLASRPEIREATRKALLEALKSSGHQYEEIRKHQRSGPARTRNMDGLVQGAQSFVRRFPGDVDLPKELFRDGAPGNRVMALAAAEVNPRSEYLELAINAIGDALSPFEQYYALRLASRTMDGADASRLSSLKKVLSKQSGVPIKDSDPSRAQIKRDLLKRVDQQRLK